MYCGNCGKKLDDGTKKCPYCGMELAPAPASESTEGDRGRGNHGYLPVGILAVLMVLAILLICRSFSGRRTLVAEDYVFYEVTGLNGEGQVQLSFDQDALLADIEEKQALTQRDREEILALLDEAQKDFYIIPEKNLFNGDKVTIQSNLDKNLLKDYKVAFKSTALSFRVEGLLDIRSIELADYLTAEFTGFEGHGYGKPVLDRERMYEDVAEEIREVDNSEETKSYLLKELQAFLDQITMEPAGFTDLKNGDEVAFTVSSENPEITEYGIRLTAGEISATAEGLKPTESLELKNYLTCTPEGYTGAGNVEVSLSLDRDGLKQKLAERLEEGELERAVSDVEKAWESSFAVSVEVPEVLTDGDKITVTCEALEEEPVYLPEEGIYLDGFTAEIEIAGLDELPTYDFSFETLGTKGILVLLDEVLERADRELADAEDRILEKINDGTGKILWDQSGISLKSAQKAYSKKANWYYNDLIFICRADLAVQQKNLSVTHKEICFAVCFYNVVEQPSGDLSYENSESGIFFEETEIAAWEEKCGEYLSGDAEVTELAAEQGKETEDAAAGTEEPSETSEETDGLKQ